MSGFVRLLLVNFGPRGGAFELGAGMVSQNAWEKIGRAVGSKTVLVTDRDHARIVAFERFN